MNKTLTFLLVSEGSTDIAFIKQLTKHLGKAIGVNVVVNELAPQKDATTNQYPSHGWTQVRAWCNSWKVKSKAELDAIPMNLRGILERKNWIGQMRLSSAHGLIIQMDTDIAEQINDVGVVFGEDSRSRRQYCQDAVLTWLNDADACTKGLYLLLPSFAIETWLLATHDSSHSVFSDLNGGFDYESISDVEQRLINLGYASRQYKHKTRLTKQYHLYEQYGDRVFSDFDDVKTRCQEAGRLSQYISKFSK